MRLLAISDIHGNVDSVRRLRWLESNRFDAVIVAGDMDSASAAEILNILTTFSCPVLYVFGNWDHDLSYEKYIYQPAVHIHGHVTMVDDFCIVGFSGCETHWGQNPYLNAAQEQFLALSVKYGGIIEKSKYLSHKANEFCSKTGTWTSQYSCKLQRLEKSSEWVSYLKDYKTIERWILDQNIADATSHWKESEVQANRTIFISHQRTFRLHEKIPGLKMHLYGHQHGFKDTSYLGTRFLNVSVMDKVHAVQHLNDEIPGNLSDLLHFNFGTYTVIELTNSDTVIVTSVRLYEDNPALTQLAICHVGSRLIHPKDELWFEQILPITSA